MDKPLVLADYLDENSLRRLAGYIGYERGYSYAIGGRVSLQEITFDRIEAIVRGTSAYRVSLSVQNGNFTYSCTCPVGEGGYFCKHLVATALKARDKVPVPDEIRWQRKLEWLMKRAAWGNDSEAAASNARNYVIVFGLNQQVGAQSMIVPLRIYLDRLSDEELATIDWNDAQELERFLKKLPSPKVEPVRSLKNMSRCLNAKSGAYLLATLLAMSYHPPENLFEWFWHYPLLLYMTSSQSKISYRLNLHPTPEKAVIVLQRNEKGLDLQLALLQGEELKPLSNKNAKLVQINPPVLLVDGTLVRVFHPSGIMLETLLNNPKIHVPAAFEEQFFQTYFLKIAEYITFVGDGIRHEEQYQPKPRLYLSEQNKELVVRLCFDYSGQEVPYDENAGYVVLNQKDGSVTFVRRNRSLEDTIEMELIGTKYGLKRLSAKERGIYTLRAKVHVLDFLVKFVPLLTKEGFEIFGEERIRSVRVNRARPKLSMQISSGIDWFDLAIVVQFGDQTASWKEVRSAILKGQEYVKLADGSIGQIPKEWVKRFQKVFALTKTTEQGVELSEAQLPLIDLLLDEAERMESFAEFEQRRRRLRDFERIESQPLPKGLRGELRPYQKAGYDWLHFLYRYKLGGCLADDMGLGKTVQVLAFLQSLKEEQKPPAAHLLVVPKSLLINWLREAERFTPELHFLDYSGSDRSPDKKAFDEVDVVLTTYGIVLRDIEKLRKYHFDLVILDESQAVKNPLSQISKAVRLLNANQRFVLSGTPIENNTFELWSQFAFLQPGLLGSLEAFRREFANPIEGEGDEVSAETLRKLVHPFILRRTKSQVAPELPPREERVVYTLMGDEQKQLYQRVRDYYRQVLLGNAAKEGDPNQNLKILEGLLRLRQISIHPALVEKSFHGESPKFTWLLETLETLQQEGHKALIFSQFVEALYLLRQELDQRAIRYAYLDGQTENRQSQVDAFQKDPQLPFFLISLKAGGVGLNLTAADYVIHLDPWWNPAVERQAADRTHRIGQDKPVFIYKVIVRDSVEEKILLLQEKKQQLVDQLIRAEGSIFKSLTREDLEVLLS